jgi:hypothetical protein
VKIIRLKAITAGLLATALTAIPAFAKDPPAKIAKIATSAQEANDGWLIDRLNGMGNEVISIDATAVKIFYPTNSFTVLVTAPFSRIVFFNPDNRVQFVESVADWRSGKNLPREMPPPPELHGTPVVYHGVKGWQITIKEDGTKRTSYPGYSLKQKPGGNLTTESTYYISEKVDLPKAEMDFVSAFFGLPNFSCFPLGFKQKTADGTEYVYSSLKSIKRMHFSKSTFALPTGYRQAASTLAVQSFAKTNPKQLDNMLEDLGVGRQFGEK